MTTKNSTCCFIGHRETNKTGELTKKITYVINNLIDSENIDTFLFGSKSKFDDICLNSVTELKVKYPYIKRVYVRAEFPYISEDYKNHLLQFYDDTYYPDKLINAGKILYIKRNMEMIDNSKFCIFYYDEDYSPNNRKSGTRIAYKYAKRKDKNIINVFV